MVKIRLKRMGAKKRPFYRLVVADSRSPRDGRFIESLGFYDPLREPAEVRVDEEKVRDWLRRGARPSDSARDLLIREGILPASARPARPAPEAAPAKAGKPGKVEEQPQAEAAPEAEASEPAAEAETPVEEPAGTAAGEEA